MKRKIVAMLMAILIGILGICVDGFQTYAEELGEDLDYSYLLTDNALIGYAQMQTKGIYLAEGYSIINKISTTKIGAGGITNAALKCKVTVASIVKDTDKILYAILLKHMK